MMVLAKSVIDRFKASCLNNLVLFCIEMIRIIINFYKLNTANPYEQNFLFADFDYFSIYATQVYFSIFLLEMVS